MLNTAGIALTALLALLPGQEKEDYRAYGQKWLTVETTDHYKIYSMLGGSQTQDIGLRQEKIFEKYRIVFPKKKFPAAHDDTLFPVLVFETRGEFEAFSRANGHDPTGAAAYYSPGKKYTVLYWGTDKSLIGTLFHEAFHQFFHHALPNTKSIPNWVNEGLASYFGGAKWDSQFGTVSIEWEDMDVSSINQTRKAILTETEIGLEELLTASYQKFHEEDQESLYYSEGLSVVFFLMNWKKKGRSSKGIKLLVKYFLALEKGAGLEEAYKKVFKKEMPRMEKSWKRAIEGMKF